MCVCAQSLSHVQLFATPWTAACQEYKFYCPWNFPRILGWVAISCSMGSS